MPANQSMYEYDDHDLLTPESAPEPTHDHYQYEPLNVEKQQFRLFKVRSSGQNGSPQCEIETFDLIEGPPFNAVSYTWGDPLPTFDIIVEDRRIKVRENLYRFLTTYQDESYLWVDQISIDQSNVDERNHQVGLMASIYSQCNCVIVWLGRIPRMPNAPLVFNATQSLEALAQLLQQNYFTRLWIIQEILLAKQITVTVDHPVCGNITVSWKNICEIAKKSIGTLRSLGAHSSALSLLTECGESRNPSLGRTISTFSRGECQDDRNKIYGLMGLVNEDERLAIDYNKSVHEVFSDVVKALCASYKKMRPISSLSHVRPTIGGYYSISLLVARRMGFADSQIRTLEDLLQTLWTPEILDYPDSSEILSHSPVTAMGFQQAKLQSKVTPREEKCFPGILREDVDSTKRLEYLKQYSDCWWYTCNGKTYEFYDPPLRRRRKKKINGEILLG